MHSQNRQQIGINFSPPFIKHRCHSCNHDAQHPNVWKIVYEEPMSPDAPPDDEGAITISANIKQDHECVYVYAPVTKAFRIKLDGYEDIVSCVCVIELCNLNL